MVTGRLHKLRKLVGAEHILVVLCVVGSVAWAGHTFLGGVFQRQSRQVTLVTSTTNQVFSTRADSVGGFLAELGMQYTGDDLVDPPPTTPVTPGLVVSYRKAVRVQLADSGADERSVMCAGETVCDLLEQTGAALGPLDRVQPSPETPLQPGMRVQIIRVKALDITHRREIPPPVAYEPDASLSRGTIEELQPGRPGLAEDITRVYYLNGNETTRIDMGSRVLVQPERKVVRLGTRSLPQIVSRGSLSGRSVLTMIATAYDPGPLSCGRSADGLTATGQIATKGVCAVDPRVIPLGTRLWVEGYGYALACDTGGAIHGNRIDVCFDSRTEALRWGRRTVTVYILE